MREREKYENALLTVRFTGNDFNVRGVNIYDLANVLLAIQRIVHKAYLAKEGRLKKGSYPSKDERPGLALQIGERRRQSDAFALIPVLTDPLVQNTVKQVIDYVLSGMVGYYTGKVLDVIHKEPDNNKKIFIGSLYSDVVNIVDRIDASGQVESISFGSPAIDRETIARFDAGTKDYLTQIKDQFFLGPYQEIRGYPYHFYPASKIVGIKRPGGNNVKVFLNRENFDQIRYTKLTKPEFIFKGHPRYRFGVETMTVTDFDADEIEYVPPRI